MDEKINRKYKDRLFRLIFGTEENKDILLSLYNALNKSNYQDLSSFEFNTLDDIIYMKMKNDVSFIISNEMNLFEHQSSFNPNMALREFEYCAKLYDKYIALNELDVYSTMQLKIPAPRCYVFYNGDLELDDVTEMHLSDSFEIESPGYEWTVKVLNVNKGHNLDLMDACDALAEYSDFVQLIKNNKASLGLQNAVEHAVNLFSQKDTRFGNIVLSNKAVVVDMMLTEYNEEKHIQSEKRISFAEGKAEGKAEGRAEGIAEGEIKTYVALVSAGKIDLDFALEQTHLSKEDFEQRLSMI